MKRKRRIKKSHLVLVLLFLICSLAMGIYLVNQVIRIDGFKSETNNVKAMFHSEFQNDAYNEKSLMMTDCSNKDVYILKNENEKQIPASLAKLYVIEYATQLANLDSIVLADNDVLSLIKPGSSTAGIEAKEYYLQNLFAAMLVPSGNDAAYVVADYCGGILFPEMKPGQERIDLFMERLNEHLKDCGYRNTVIHDPSGFDSESQTTAMDLNDVVNVLIKFQWFRNIISQSEYTAELPDGTVKVWQNTNAYLDITSEYYNENVIGVKTGSLNGNYNLIVLYQIYGKEFLIISLGSQSDSSRYDDVSYILNKIDNDSAIRNIKSVIATN